MPSCLISLNSKAAVGLLQALDAVLAFDELGRAAQHQFGGFAGKVGVGLDAVLLRHRAGHGQGLGVVEGRGGQPGELVLLLVAFFDGLVDLIGILQRAELEHGQQAGGGVLRVEVDLAADDGLMGDGGAAQVELALDFEAFLLQQLGVHLGHDELLGEVLGADFKGAEALSLREQPGRRRKAAGRSLP